MGNTAAICRYEIECSPSVRHEAGLHSDKPHCAISNGEKSRFVAVIGSGEVPQGAGADELAPGAA